MSHVAPTPVTPVASAEFAATEIIYSDLEETQHFTPTGGAWCSTFVRFISDLWWRNIQDVCETRETYTVID